MGPRGTPSARSVRSSLNRCSIRDLYRMRPHPAAVGPAPRADAERTTSTKGWCFPDFCGNCLGHLCAKCSLGLRDWLSFSTAAGDVSPCARNALRRCPMVRSGSARSIGQPALPAAIPGDASVARDELLRCLSTRSFVPYRSFAKANYKLIAVDARCGAEARSTYWTAKTLARCQCHPAGGTQRHLRYLSNQSANLSMSNQMSASRALPLA